MKSISSFFRSSSSTQQSAKMSTTIVAPTHPVSSSGKSLEKSLEFVELIKQRRSIRAIENKPILSQSDLLKIIQQTVRESPSPYNIQTSRILILLGEENSHYWLNIILPTMETFFKNPEGKQMFKEKFAPRFEGFAKGTGSVLFFEDQKELAKAKETFTMAAPKMNDFSLHSTGMAQINTWNALSLAGYGASLQHMGEAAKPLIIEKYNIPSDWVLHAELVFGSPAEVAAEKTYIDDATRFTVKGSF